MTIVDIHPHIVSPDTDHYPITPIGGKRSDWSDKHSVDLETMIAAMDAAGVDKAAVVHSSTTYGFNCEYVADSIARYPDRLTGVFSIDVLAPDAVEKMKKWVGLNMTGMRIFSRGSTLKGAVLAIDDPAIGPCYDFAAEIAMPVVSNVTIDKFSQLENVLKQFPDTIHVVDHLGSADFSEGFDAAKALFDLAKYPNLYLKVSSRNFTKARDQGNADSVFPKLVSEFGADRMAWASNYPANTGTLGDLLDLARGCLQAVSKNDQVQILGGTAQKLYPVLADNQSVTA
ncbi:amidohydrolase family protein [Puniceibacterium confluentis]|uniref:amidohydrolase family protein n=1 Tax=Puniceibacterium confluentis TaxID=1958944 RepID=UPI0011B7B9EB|nr:amidohydrolase family protein [Puniceibacterium confluentis]